MTGRGGKGGGRVFNNNALERAGNGGHTQEKEIRRYLALFVRLNKTM